MRGNGARRLGWAAGGEEMMRAFFQRVLLVTAAPESTIGQLIQEPSYLQRRAITSSPVSLGEASITTYSGYCASTTWST